LWLTKARGIGRALEHDRETWMSQEEREAVKRIFRGFEIVRDI
jgi:hypothetical protein